VTTFYQWQNGDLLLNIRVQPKASKDEFAEQLGDVIKIRITAPPIDGKANNHLIAFLGKTFGIARSQIEIISGQNSRIKRLKIKSPKILPEFIQSTNQPVRTQPLYKDSTNQNR